MKLKSIALIFLISLIPLSIILFNGIPVGADFINHFRFVQPFYDEIVRGNYFPGWLAESNNGFGDPRFRFYPPLLYYSLCLAKFFTNDWYAATIIVFIFFTFVGALGVYFWTKQSFSNSTALLAAFIFAFVPYHLAQFFQASLLAEFVATSLLPYSFLFVERLTTNDYTQTDGKTNKSRLVFDIAGLAAAYSLIIIAHLPTTVVASITLGVFTLLLTDWRNNFKSLVWCGLGVFLGLLSSSWFWFRMLSELGWIQAGENVSSAYYDYRNNFLFSPYSLSNLNTWFGGFLLALTIGYFLPSVNLLSQIFGKKDFNENTSAIINSQINTPILKKRFRAIFFVIIISIFMMTDLSRPVWAIIPKLKDIQFPYRWLVITSVLICSLTAASLIIWIKHIKRNGLRPIVLVLLISFALTFVYTLYEIVIDTEYISRSTFYEQIEESRKAKSFNDWLPKNARELKDLVPMKGNVDAGAREVIISDWSSMKRTFSVGEGIEKIARVRTYNYPLWQAFILKDGQRIQTETASEIDGTLLVTIPSEKAEVEVVFVEPSRTFAAIWISLLGWLIILGLLLQRVRKIR